jgi:hypothetical protein
MKRGDGYGIFRLKELKQNIAIQYRDSLYRLRCIRILNVARQTRPEGDGKRENCPIRDTYVMEYKVHSLRMPEPVRNPDWGIYVRRRSIWLFRLHLDLAEFPFVTPCSTLKHLAIWKELGYSTVVGATRPSYPYPSGCL